MNVFFAGHICFVFNLFPVFFFGHAVLKFTHIQLIAKLPKHEQDKAYELIENIEKRIAENADEIVKSKEEDLWLMLRDVEPISVSIPSPEGVMEEQEVSFPEWFLEFKEYAKKRYIFDQISTQGKLPNQSIKFWEGNETEESKEKEEKFHPPLIASSRPE